MPIIPNLITTTRLLLSIPISISIYQGSEGIALILFIVAGLSDGLDGFLARKFSWESKFGRLLDPLADKCLILSTLLALAFAELLPIWFVGVLLIRDAVVVMGSILYLTIFEGRNSKSNRWGKHYTGWTIAMFIIILLNQSLLSFTLFLDLLFKVSLFGVLSFSLLSLFYYFKEQGREVFLQLFRN